MPWNQAATSIGDNNSFVYPITCLEFQALRLRSGGLRPPQRGRHVLRVHDSRSSSTMRPAVARYILNDWSTTGIFQYSQRRSVNHFLECDSNLDGSGQNRDRAVYSGSGAYGRQHLRCGRGELPVVVQPGQPSPIPPAAASGTWPRVPSSARTTSTGMRAWRASSPSRADRPEIPRRILQPA